MKITLTRRIEATAVSTYYVDEYILKSVNEILEENYINIDNTPVHIDSVEELERLVRGAIETDYRIMTETVFWNGSHKLHPISLAEVVWEIVEDEVYSEPFDIVDYDTIDVDYECN